MRGSIVGKLVVVAMVGALSSGPAFAGSHEGETAAPEWSGGRKAASAPAEASGGKKVSDRKADDAASEKKTPPPSKREGS